MRASCMFLMNREIQGREIRKLESAPDYPLAVSIQTEDGHSDRVKHWRQLRVCFRRRQGDLGGWRSRSVKI